jgi:hypothetical protein
MLRLVGIGPVVEDVQDAGESLRDGGHPEHDAFHDKRKSQRLAAP